MPTPVWCNLFPNLAKQVFSKNSNYFLKQCKPEFDAKFVWWITSVFYETFVILHVHHQLQDWNYITLDVSFTKNGKRQEGRYVSGGSGRPVIRSSPVQTEAVLKCPRERHWTSNGSWCVISISTCVWMCWQPMNWWMSQYYKSPWCR